MRNQLVVVLGVLVLTACTSTPPGPEQQGAPIEDRGAKTIETPQVQRVEPSKVEGNVLAILKDPKSILSKRSVYFDFDQYVVKDEFRPLVEAHARFLMGHPTMKMLIQGNTDERGSREYNLALGQKRADAVKRSLGLLGVKDDQVESVSLGEEKPKAQGHDEGAWAENRRADMLYSGEF